MIPFHFRFLVIITLTILYAVYLFEIFKHVTSPERLLPHKKRKHRKRLFFIFILGVSFIIGIIYMVREFLLPRPIFDLIVVSLELVFIIPFFGSIFSDLLLHAWDHKRYLAHILNTLNIALPACIGITTNLLILFASQETIESISYVLNITTDIATVGIISVLGLLGLTHWQNIKKR